MTRVRDGSRLKDPNEGRVMEAVIALRDRQLGGRKGKITESAIQKKIGGKARSESHLGLLAINDIAQELRRRGLLAEDSKLGYRPTDRDRAAKEVAKLNRTLQTRSSESDL